MIDIIETVKTAERCQRNWDHSKPVLEEHVQQIVNVATNMPTKNNRSYYDLIVSTNKEFNRTCYKYAVDSRNLHFKDREIHRNTQVDAPLLLMWRTTDLDSIDNPFDDSYQKDFHISVGISSGAAVLTANQLGYRTGYCQCFESGPLFDTLEQKFNLPIVNTIYKDLLVVGIGNPDSNFKRTQCVIDGKVGYTAESVNKTIDITYIE
jgi:nitroreductase